MLAPISATSKVKTPLVTPATTNVAKKPTPNVRKDTLSQKEDELFDAAKRVCKKVKDFFLSLWKIVKNWFQGYKDVIAKKISTSTIAKRFFSKKADKQKQKVQALPKKPQCLRRRLLL